MNCHKNIPHRFDLTGTKVGDWFLGCSKCWFRLPVNVAAKPVCPECRGDMQVYDFTPADLRNRTHP